MNDSICRRSGDVPKAPRKLQHIALRSDEKLYKKGKGLYLSEPGWQRSPGSVGMNFFQTYFIIVTSTIIMPIC